MVHYTKVVHGLAEFINQDIVSKLNGSMKAWVVGGIVVLVSNKASALFNELKKTPMIESLGIIDGEMIDIETIYNSILPVAQKGSATINIPMIGAVTYSATDVESAYRYIVGGA